MLSPLISAYYSVILCMTGEANTAEGVSMLSIRLPKDVEERLQRLAEKTGRSKSYFARQAIIEFIEDREDYLIALARLERKDPTVPIEELERRLGLED